MDVGPNRLLARAALVFSEGQRVLERVRDRVKLERLDRDDPVAELLECACVDR